MPWNSWKSFDLADELIKRFRVEQVEGGIIVAGRPFQSSPCPILTLVFSGCFLTIGIILTVLAYRPVSSNVYLRLSSSSHITGPFLLVIGFVFLVVGLALYIVTERLKPEDPVVQPTRQKSYRKRFLPWIQRRSSQMMSKPIWMSSGSGKRIFNKRNQVIQDLLHNSTTTEFICRNDSISDFNCRGDIASFPSSFQSSPCASNVCLAV